MALGPTYTKFGGADLSGMGENLMAGQKAFTQSVRDAVAGVDDLLEKTQEHYRNENTANLEAQFKSQLFEQGLSADEIDTSEIRSQYGDLVDVDRLNETIGNERNRLEEEALNSAFQKGNKIFDETGNERLARIAVENDLSSQGGKAKFISNALQTFTDLNKTKAADYEALQTEKLNDYGQQITAGIAEGGMGAGMALKQKILATIQDPTEKERVSDHIDGVLEKRSQIRGYQAEQNQRLVNDFKVEREEGAIQLAQQRSDLETEYQTLQNQAIPESGSSIAKQITSQFSKNVEQAIDDELGFGNWIDVAEFKAMGSYLRQNGYNYDESQAALAHVFGMNYDGSSWHGNNIQTEPAWERIKELANLKGMLVEKSNALSDAREAEALYNRETNNLTLELTDDLYETSRDYNIGYGKQSAADWFKTSKFKNNVNKAKAGTTKKTAKKVEPVADATLKRAQLRLGLQNDAATATDMANYNATPEAAEPPKKVSTTLFGGVDVEKGSDSSVVSRFLKNSKTTSFKQEQIKTLEDRIRREKIKPENKRRPAEIRRWEALIKKLQQEVK